MLILVQFLLRLAFGLALAMAITPSRQVTSGYYRNHSYVLLGLGALATLVAFSRPDVSPPWTPGAVAVFSYVSAVCWLYERRRAGLAALSVVSVLSLAGAWSSLALVASSPLAQPPSFRADWLLSALDPVSSGLLLGTTIAAMFLGHWYLNTPTMNIAPLRRLLQLLAAAVVLRAVVCGGELLLDASALTDGDMLSRTLLTLRWAAGIAGTAVATWMSWQTLKIPNTQSATGILYVAVIFTFLGELAGLLPLAGAAG